MRVYKTVMIGAALAIGAVLAAGQQPAQRGGFPHARHAKLFPTCTGCHSGVVSGDAKEMIPAPAVCAQCHNGTDQKTIAWSGASLRATNLKFTHAGHDVKSAEAGSPATCVSCHTDQVDTSWMHVRAAQGGVCVACHANQAGEHLAPDAVCSTCHTTLVDSRALTKQQIAAFPKPASHASADFLSTHAPKTSAALAQCATCHARESCQRCHANAGKINAISQLGSDARVKELTRGVAAKYPTPDSHKGDGWATGHGTAAAASIQQCANCHTQPACKSCHAGGTPSGSKAQKLIAALPNPVKDGASGVTIVNARVHPADFLAQHKTTAASGRMDCTQCHQERECSSCHEGSSSRRYHPRDFVARHAPAAYAQDQECSSCHRTETFCRSCHLQSNMTAKGAKTGAAHTGQPMWLLQHSQAARLNLTGCTSCHQQRDCLRCHSSTGLHVNPHGPNFDAQGMSSRYKQMCATCHVTDPLKK